MSQPSDLLPPEPLRKLLANIQTLPSLPSVYRELMDALHADDASIEQTARIIAGTWAW